MLWLLDGLYCLMGQSAPHSFLLLLSRQKEILSRGKTINSSFVSSIFSSLRLPSDKFSLFSTFSEFCFWGERKEKMHIFPLYCLKFSLDLLGPCSSNKITHKGGKKSTRKWPAVSLGDFTLPEFVMLQKSADEYSFHRRAPPINETRLADLTYQTTCAACSMHARELIMLYFFKYKIPPFRLLMICLLMTEGSMWRI